MDGEELWAAAKDTMERIQSGELEATQAQYNRLQKLLQGYDAYLKADFELKRGMTCLCYERYFYLIRIIWNLEKLGISNNWHHALLQQAKDIIYEENDQFKLESRAEN